MNSNTEITLDDQEQFIYIPMDSTILEMKERFMEKIQSMIKASNTALIDSYEKYQQIIQEVELAKETKQKTPLQYRRIKRYDVMYVGEVKKLIRPLSNDVTEIKYFIPNEELFDVIHDAHLECDHGRRDIMLKILAEKYANVTREAVLCYLDLCVTCQENRKDTKKISTKKQLSEVAKSGGQVDIIDMQVANDASGFRYVLKFQDHLTNFVMLRALKSSMPPEVASALSDIFCTIGAPSVLHIINRKVEFASMVTDKLKTLWPDMVVVYCKPSRNRESAKRSNQDVKDILYAWMEDNKTKHWTEGLCFCQLIKNNMCQGKTKRTPFEAMFGKKSSVEISSSDSIRAHVIETETQFEAAVNQDPLSLPLDGNNVSKRSGTFLSNAKKEILILPDDSELHMDANDCCICGKETPGVQKCYICDENVHANCSHSGSSLEEDFQSVVVCLNCASKDCMVKTTKRPHEKHKLGAVKRVKSSKKLPAIEIGKSVLVQVPSVDKNKMDVCNILGVVMHMSKDGLYKIGTKNGLLMSLYARNQLQSCEENFVKITEVPDRELSLKDIMNQNDVFKGPNFLKCNCYFKCSTKSCKCRRLKMLCNSKCHHSTACCNK